MISHQEKMNKSEAIFRACLNTLDAKGRDYSGTQDAMSNFRDFGAMGIVVRIGDKYNRIKNIMKSGEQHVKDESVKDTLEDTINYCVLALIMIEEEEKKDTSKRCPSCSGMGVLPNGEICRACGGVIHDSLQ